MIGIIDKLRDYFENKDYYFLAGNRAYINAINDRHVYEKNELIAFVEITSSNPTITNGRLASMTSNLNLAIGRKREDTDGIETVSSLDETYMQKYTRRLRDLETIWIKDVAQFMCDEQMTAQSINIRQEINSFDLNADFIAGTVILVKE